MCLQLLDEANRICAALAIDPLSIKADGGPPVNYVMEPAVMQAVMRQVEKETIDYK